MTEHTPKQPLKPSEASKVTVTVPILVPSPVTVTAPEPQKPDATKGDPV